MKNNIVGVLLAAGRSKRFGSNKLMHCLDSGLTMAEHCASQLIRHCPNSIAVVSDQHSQLAKKLSAIGLDIIENLDTDAGMSSSIACAVAKTKDADAWLITLADMPFIKDNSIKSILIAFNTKPCIIRPTHKGQPGHPVLFSQDFYQSLTTLDGDTGAKNITQSNIALLKQLEVNDPGILQDIDYPSDIVNT